MHINISIGAEHLFDILGFPVTNTMLTSWIVVALLVIFSVFFSRHIKKHPNGRLAIGMESILSGFIDFMSSFAGDKKTVRKFIPLIATIFFYVLISNWVGTLPGIETIGLEKEVATEHGMETEFLPLFRTVNSDLNMTLILALIIVFSSHIIGLYSIGAKHHIGKFIVNPFKKPIGFFVGILEIIGEFSRVISLAFRLFGNIFAGSVLMLIISSLVKYVVPIPFLGLELFVGFIQALVISVLAMLVISASIHKHSEEH